MSSYPATGRAHTGAAFPSTRWSLVLSVRDRDSRSAEALAALCEAYWPPIYSFARRRGYPPDQAEDLTQGFFTKLIEKNYVAQADRDRGKLRTFLLSSFKHYLANEWDRRQAEKRGGGRQFLSLDFERAEGRFHAEPAETTTPETLFVRQWAQTLLDNVLGKLRREYEANGNKDRFERFKVFLPGAEPSVPYRELAAELDMTETNLRVAVHRLRHRFGHLLRKEVKHTVQSEDAVAEEIRFLIEALR